MEPVSDDGDAPKDPATDMVLSLQRAVASANRRRKLRLGLTLVVTAALAAVGSYVVRD
jgi:hypothetical protein